MTSTTAAVASPRARHACCALGVFASLHSQRKMSVKGFAWQMRLQDVHDILHMVSCSKPYSIRTFRRHSFLLLCRKSLESWVSSKYKSCATGCSRPCFRCHVQLCNPSLTSSFVSAEKQRYPERRTAGSHQFATTKLLTRTGSKGTQASASTKQVPTGTSYDVIINTSFLHYADTWISQKV